jgi:FolB domain-containing protein
MGDKIIIQDLEVRSHIGVTAAERRKPQRLLITIEMEHPLKQAGTTDDLRKTIDYDAVARRMRALAGGGERKLIERLAEEIARMVLKEFRPESVSVTVKKFVLCDTQWVAVTIHR